MPGLFIACHHQSRFALASLVRFRRPQTPNLFRIGQQWAIDLDPIPRLNHMLFRVTDLLAEDPHRTSRQIQFGKLLPDG